MIVCHVLMRNNCPHQPGTTEKQVEDSDDGIVRRQRRSRSAAMARNDLMTQTKAKRGRPKKAKSKPRRRVGRPRKNDSENIEVASLSPLSYEKDLP